MKNIVVCLQTHVNILISHILYTIPPQSVYLDILIRKCFWIMLSEFTWYPERTSQNNVFLFLKKCWIIKVTLLMNHVFVFILFQIINLFFLVKFLLLFNIIFPHMISTHLDFLTYFFWFAWYYFTLFIFFLYFVCCC